MLKLNGILAGALLSVSAHAAITQPKPIVVKVEMSFSFDVRADQAGKEISSYDCTGYKAAKGKVRIEGQAFKAVTIEKKPVEFVAGGTSITLNAGHSASAVGIVDAGELNDNLTYVKTATGFKILGAGFQNTFDVIMASQKSLGRSTNLLSTLFPNANENELKVSSTSMQIVGDLDCVKSVKKNRLTCTINFVRKEDGQVLVNEATTATFNKSIELLRRAQ